VCVCVCALITSKVKYECFSYISHVTEMMSSSYIAPRCTAKL